MKKHSSLQGKPDVSSKGHVRITIQPDRPNGFNFMHDYKGSLFRIFRSDVRSALQRFFENRHAPITPEIARELIDANTFVPSSRTRVILQSPEIKFLGRFYLKILRLLSVLRPTNSLFFRIGHHSLWQSELLSRTSLHPQPQCIRQGHQSLPKANFSPSRVKPQR